MQTFLKPDPDKLNKQCAIAGFILISNIDWFNKPNDPNILSFVYFAFYYLFRVQNLFNDAKTSVRQTGQ